MENVTEFASKTDHLLDKNERPFHPQSSTLAPLFKLVYRGLAELAVLLGFAPVKVEVPF